VSAQVISLLGACDKPECARVASDWQVWAARKFGKYDPALIDLSADYQQLIGAKSRNMIRKAERSGYRYGYFVFNDSLDAMHEINTSLPERGGLAMTASYTERSEPISTVQPCRHHGTFYVGGAKDGRLLAYCFLSISGELAIVNRILGHGSALPDGVMNGLVNNLVTVAREHGAKWLNYLTIESRTEGLMRFKKNVGFRSTPVVFIL
jgi:hypothetical protein